MPIDAFPVFDIKNAVLKEDDSLEKAYMDISDNHEWKSQLSHDLEIVRAGTTITSMPQSDYCEEYKRFADEYDIRFIFENDVPTIDFYTVPQFDICAMDSEGGYIGTIGNLSDFELDYPIGYIDKDRNCFIIASCGKEFLENAANWKVCKQAYDDISFFESKEDAQNKLAHCKWLALTLTKIREFPFSETP